MERFLSAKEDRIEQERWDEFYLDEADRLEDKHVDWKISERLGK